MRAIGNLSDEHQARLFSDYLLARGIRNQVEWDRDASGGAWTLWVADDDQLDSGRQLLEAFRRQPNAPHYAQKAREAATVRAQEEADQDAWRRRVTSGQQLFPRVRRSGPAFLAVALIVACILVAVWTELGQNRDVMSHFFISNLRYRSSGFLSEVLHGELWRLVSPMLIHYGATHLIFNLLWLYQLGSQIESAQGTLRFGLLVLLFAIGSNLTQYYFKGPFFGGMSGVNYGLIGYVWMRGRFDPASGLHLDTQNATLALVWFFVCITGWLGVSVANHAHAGGLILGLGVGIGSGLWARRR